MYIGANLQIRRIYPRGVVDAACRYHYCSNLLLCRNWSLAVRSRIVPLSRREFCLATHAVGLYITSVVGDYKPLSCGGWAGAVDRRLMTPAICPLVGANTTLITACLRARKCSDRPPARARGTARVMVVSVNRR